VRAAGQEQEDGGEERAATRPAQNRSPGARAPRCP
jgi:hypothetical protein